MTSFSVKLSLAELHLLTALAADQLFRREFIDSRMPGNGPNTVELTVGKKLVERLRAIADHGYPARVQLRKEHGAKA